MPKFVFIFLLICSITSCDSPEARRPISSKTGNYIKSSISLNKKLYQEEKTRIDQLIKKDTSKQFISSKKGFWYAYDTKIDSDSLLTPGFNDLVDFSFNISTLDEIIIYSKEDLKPRKYLMDKQPLFTGLREGLKLLKAGESATFIFPSQLAYGYYGDENKIGTNTPIICNVTINSIIKNNNK
jgi:gliding motility-associated peptidyl-prolyl isomerase